MDRAKNSQMLDDGGVDFSNPVRVSIEKITDCDAWHANVCLVDGRELPLTVCAHPTRHPADCAAAATVIDQASPRSRVPARGRCSTEHGQRAVAQLGSALDWGARGREFKSRQPDKPMDAIRPSWTGIQPI